MGTTPSSRSCVTRARRTPAHRPLFCKKYVSAPTGADLRRVGPRPRVVGLGDVSHAVDGCRRRRVGSGRRAPRASCRRRRRGAVVAAGVDPGRCREGAHARPPLWASARHRPRAALTAAKRRSARSLGPDRGRDSRRPGPRRAPAESVAAVVRCCRGRLLPRPVVRHVVPSQHSGAVDCGALVEPRPADPGPERCPLASTAQPAGAHQLGRLSFAVRDFEALAYLRAREVFVKQMHCRAPCRKFDGGRAAGGRCGQGVVGRNVSCHRDLCHEGAEGPGGPGPRARSDVGHAATSFLRGRPRGRLRGTTTPAMNS